VAYFFLGHPVYTHISLLLYFYSDFTETITPPMFISLV